MRLVRKMMHLVRKLISRIARSLAPVRWKEFNEFGYWKKTKKVQGELSNDRYEHFYTTHFGLDRSYYENSCILDIGCGPKGSLDWASMASRRIGLDPLAKKYLRLGASRHQMQYIDAPSENIPLKDAECDVVSSFNSLDHVEDVHQTLGEIKRVTRPGGIFLLLVEVNHPPTDLEPHYLAPMQLLDWLKPGLDCEGLQVYEPAAEKIDQSIDAARNFPIRQTQATPVICRLSSYGRLPLDVEVVNQSEVS